MIWGEWISPVHRPVIGEYIQMHLRRMTDGVEFYEEGIHAGFEENISWLVGQDRYDVSRGSNMVLRWRKAQLPEFNKEIRREQIPAS